MANQEWNKRVEDNVKLYGRKSFDNPELQQHTSGNDIRQIDEAINSQSLMLEDQQHRNFSEEWQTEKQVNFETLYHDESSRRDEAEISDDTVNENSGNWDFGNQQSEKDEVVPNVFSKENIEQRTPIGELGLKINGTVFPEDFTTNTILIGIQFSDGKLLDVIGGLSNIANDPERGLHLQMTEYEKLEETETPDEILHLIPTSNEGSQETPLNAESSERVHSKELIKREIHAELEYFVSEAVGEREKIKGDVIHLTMIDKAHRFTEDIPLEQDKLGKTSIKEKYFGNLAFFENEEGFAVERKEIGRRNELMESLVSEYDPENATQKISREDEPEKEIAERRSKQPSMNIKLAQVLEKPENVKKIDERREQFESQEVQENALYEEQQEKETNAEIDGNIKTPNKSMGMILKEKKKASETSVLVHESKIVPEEGRKSDSAPNISGPKHKMDSQESDGNTAVNSATVKVKSTGSLGSVNMWGTQNSKKGTKSKHSSPNELMTISKDALNVTSLKSTLKTTKKALPVTTVKMLSESRDGRSNRMVMTDRKSMTKSAVALPSPLVSMKTTILKEKNVEETGLKHTKNVMNSNNVKTSKQNITSTKTPTVRPTSKLTQKKLQESVNFAKSRLNNDAKPNVKDIITDYHKTTKTTENDEKGLIGMKKKIEIANFEPLVWSESLMPVYEQIWESYESTMEKKIEEEMKVDEVIENLEISNSESVWEMKKDSEFMETEVTKSVSLSDKDGITVPQCFVLSYKDEKKFIRDLSDPSKIGEEQNEKITVEEEIVVNDGSGKREIGISGSVPIKSFEATEVSLKMELKISLEQKTLGTIIGQGIEADTSKNLGNSHEIITEVMVPTLKPNPPESQNEAEVGADNGKGKTITAEDVKKIEGTKENEGKMPPEKEKPEVKFERDDGSKESEQTEKKASILAGSGSEQQAQPRLETNNSRRHGDGSRSKHYQRKGQFGGMYSDVPEECRHNAAGKDGSRKHQQIGWQQNYSQLQDNYQQQPSGHQNHSPKQQQQPGDANGGYNQNYSGQQGHRKRNKRNKKPRNW
uniref:LsmAD domain-containing protein n=2 Tax=Loa loa TaxID=7209 RepID=A0A1I7VQQ0_LOALO